MKTFLIGGTGLLGSAVAAELIKRGNEVQSLALPPVPEGANIPPEMKIDFKNYLTLTDDEIRNYMKGCDNFVFATGVDERVDGPSPIYDFYCKYNNIPLKKFLTIAKECGVKHAGICGSYFSYFDKQWPKKELSKWHPYIRSRIDQEKMAMEFADNNFSVAVLELPYIFGAQKGREPVWTLIVNVVRGMPGATFFPRGGSATVTVKQVAQAMAGALERTKGGQCWPIGYYNKSWKELYSIVHKHMGYKHRLFITIPDWMLKLGIKSMEKKLRKPGAEGGLYMPKFADIQCAETYIDKNLGCIPLGVQEDDIDSAIGESIHLAMDVIDGKAKNVVAMKGE